MKPKRRRLIFVASGLCALGLAVALVLVAFEEGIVFFYSPSDLAEIDVPQGRTIRVGGLVEEGSVEQGEDATVAFHITDLNQVVKVNYKGILPDLFREGQGVVVVGVMEADGGFTANEVLAKHDENYMPSEVVDALKESGEWQREPAP
jgi:cytochrome c-type biogenesis protein CcmE